MGAIDENGSVEVASDHLVGYRIVEVLIEPDTSDESHGMYGGSSHIQQSFARDIYRILGDALSVGTKTDIVYIEKIGSLYLFEIVGG